MYKWRGREKVFPWFFFFYNSEVANAEVVLQEIFLWILASLLGVFYFLGMGMEKPSASVQLILTSFCDLIARPFLTWDWVWVKVGSRMLTSGFHNHILLLKNSCMNHPSSTLMADGKGESPSCLIRKLLKVEVDP